MNELITKLKNRGFRFVSVYDINPINKYRTSSAKVRKIIKVTDEGVIGYSNMIKGGLKIFHKFPKENYEMTQFGYIEPINCGKYGVKYRELVFSVDIPR